MKAYEAFYSAGWGMVSVELKIPRNYIRGFLRESTWKYGF